LNAVSPQIESSSGGEEAGSPGGVWPGQEGRYGTSGRWLAVVDYGIGNLRSAEKALQRVGAPARLVSDPGEVLLASGVVLPGVGAFGPCAKALRQTGMEAAVRDALAREVPFLGICVGMQLLYEGSEEDTEARGLGVLEGVVRLLPGRVKRPQMQWNVLRPVPGAPSSLMASLGEEPWVYFVHSYAPEMSPDAVATCDYGGEVVAMAERGPVFGTQFHPEKSGSRGLAFLRAFASSCLAERGDGPGAWSR
jgi:glutamine amidotransferase